MTILVVSDTHGRADNLKKVLNSHGMPDALIHLGDSECGEEGIRRLVDCPIYMVAGNCDFFTDLPKTRIVEIGGIRMLLTHGHYYYVSVGMRDLTADAKVNDCRIAMFGHTHRPMLDCSDAELTVLNPGSLSFPRQEGKQPSYAILEIPEDGKPEISIHYL